MMTFDLVRLKVAASFTVLWGCPVCALVWLGSTQEIVLVKKGILFCFYGVILGGGAIV